ncbi:coiled-coil domain-containing protein 42 homolog [Hetaerina americana]|uniref:coiled-coil domain-containing protein 42 homolog n=1 Tax=Hetaerina americana TaxID=62018 RepID=UPI003A7F2E4A
MDSVPTDLAYPADIETAPEKAVADYLISRKLETELIKKVPDWDVARDSPDANLLLAKRALEETKCVLKREKAICDERATVINKKWDELRKKQNELRDSFFENSSVIKKNYKERQRSKKQIIGEEIEEQRIEEEIAELQKKLQLCNEAEAVMLAKVNEFKMYEEYLQKVIDTYPEFNSIDDVLNRYESLVETRGKLKRLQETNINLVEKIRKDVEDLSEENIKEMQELTQKLSDLRIKKYHVEAEIDHWSQAIERIKDLGTEDYLEITKAIDGIWLIYMSMCDARKHKPKFNKSQLKEQLKYIVDNMNILHEVLIEAHRFMNKSKSPSNKHEIPSKRELDEWSVDYEEFQSIKSTRAKAPSKVSEPKC